MSESVAEAILSLPFQKAVDRSRTDQLEAEPSIRILARRTRGALLHWIHCRSFHQKGKASRQGAEIRARLLEVLEPFRFDADFGQPSMKVFDHLMLYVER